MSDKLVVGDRVRFTKTGLAVLLAYYSYLSHTVTGTVVGTPVGTPFPDYYYIQLPGHGVLRLKEYNMERVE